MDTLKSLAVISLLGAVLYGVYVVASKPDKALSPEMEAMTRDADRPLIDDGRNSPAPPRIETPSSNSTAPDERGPRVSPWTRPRSQGEEASAPAPPPDPFGARGAGGSAAESERPNVRTIPYEESSKAPSDSDTGYSPAPQEPANPDAGSSRSSAVDDAEIEAAKARLRLYAFRKAWMTAREQAHEGRHREALLALTPFYRDPAIPDDEQQELIGWLDALAAKVVYSTEHLMESAHSVRRGQTLYDIADIYHVPFLLLKNINGVRDNTALLPGTSLKVLRGPFRAEVDLTHHDITVFVQNLYAGRFPFTLGSDPVQPGEYLVKAKDPVKQYASPQGVIGPKDPRNPYGGLYIDLGNSMSIHGSPGDAYADQHVGCIQLAPRDAEDLFAILSKDESTVVIRK